MECIQFIQSLFKNMPRKTIQYIYAQSVSINNMFIIISVFQCLSMWLNHQSSILIESSTYHIISFLKNHDNILKITDFSIPIIVFHLSSIMQQTSKVLKFMVWSNHVNNYKQKSSTMYHSPRKLTCIWTNI